MHRGKSTLCILWGLPSRCWVGIKTNKHEIDISKEKPNNNQIKSINTKTKNLIFEVFNVIFVHKHNPTSDRHHNYKSSTMKSISQIIRSIYSERNLITEE